MKINKKIWARIGAILACVLLVGALSVPCFAATNAEQRAETLFRSFYSDSSVFQNLSFRYFNTGRMITEYEILTGGLLLDSSTIPWDDVYASGEYYDITVSIPVAFSYDFSVESGDGGDHNVVTNGLVSARFVRGDDLNYPQFGTMEIAFFDVDAGTEPVPEIIITYQLEAVNGYIACSPFDVWHYYYSERWQYFDYFYVTIGVLPSNYGVPSMFYDLYSAMFGDIGQTEVLYPLSFKEGVLQAFVGSSYQQGYQDGLTDGIQQGFQEGYDAGEIVGDANGYERGYQDGMRETQEEVWNDGYNQAISDIDSGDFGRNFLGNSFNAPFRALESFVLVSWTLQNGTVIRITLMTVFSAVIGVSLFIWFLKMFSGG